MAQRVAKTPTQSTSVASDTPILETRVETPEAISRSERKINVSPAEINALLDKFEEMEWTVATGVQVWILADDMAEVLRKIVNRNLPERNA